MLPNDDVVEIVDQDNNVGELAEKPNEEDAHNRSVEIYPGFEATEEQNFRELKILVATDSRVQTMYTMEVPFSCDVNDIVKSIFSSAQILKDGGGFKLVEDDRTERSVRVYPVDGRVYQYMIEVTTPAIIAEPHESLDDCQIAENAEKFLSAEQPARYSTPKSVDSQETYFEGVAQTAADSQEDIFYSCLDEKNDVDVRKNKEHCDAILSQNCLVDKNDIDAKKNKEHCDALFALLSQNDLDQDKNVRQDEEETEAKAQKGIHSREQDDDKEAEAEAQNAIKSYEIETSRFYSPTTRILQRSSSLSQKTVQLSDSPFIRKHKSSKSPRETILTVYPPPPARGGITIYKDNYTCLGESEYLNDVIIDFYLKYLTIEVLSEEDRNRTHLFSSQFFTRLSKPPVKNDETDVVVPESERRHIGVQRWTKNVNIFEKDFVIIPINEHYHWNLAIICYPGLVGMIDDDTEESLIRPCILFFDSLSSNKKDRVAAILRGYLSQEYFFKMGEEKNFSNDVLKARYPRVPRQSNATDCGLYVLEYVEQFFKCPIMDFTVPLDLSKWFKSSVIRSKRAEIASLVAELAKNYNPNKTVSIPVLQFPSDKVSSDEEDFDCHITTRKNPLYKEKYPSFTTNNKLSSDEESSSSPVAKKKKIDQSDLDDKFDRVKDAPSSSNQIKTFQNVIDQNDYLMDVDENDVFINEQNDSNGDKSVEITSPFQLPRNSSFFSKIPKQNNSNAKHISVIKENFSGAKRHLFQKTSIFSDETEKQPSSGIHQKRECRTKPKSEKMIKLATKFQEQKKKKELKMIRDGEVNKKPIKWIDESVFKSSEPFYKFSAYAAEDEQGIPTSISYNTYKMQQKNLAKIHQY